MSSAELDALVKELTAKTLHLIGETTHATMQVIHYWNEVVGKGYKALRDVNRFDPQMIAVGSAQKSDLPEA